MSLTKQRIATFTIVYFTGILAQLAMFCTVFWWGITGTLGQNLMAIIIMIVQGVLLLCSGGWWLPVAAKITGAGPGDTK